MDRRLTTRLLLACGPLGSLLWVTVSLVEGATRPGYSAWRHAVSQLSLGELGWMNVANFIIGGLLILGFALGLRRALRTSRGAVWGPRLVAAVGLCLIVAGIFPIDPSLGYPPGAGGTHTPQGLVHAIAGTALIGFVGATCFVLARRFAADARWRAWASRSILAGVLTMAIYIACAIVTTLDQYGILSPAPGGLLQRIVIGFGWLALVALRLMREAAPAATSATTASLLR